MAISVLSIIHSIHGKYSEFLSATHKRLDSLHILFEILRGLIKIGSQDKLTVHATEARIWLAINNRFQTINPLI